MDFHSYFKYFSLGYLLLLIKNFSYKVIFVPSPSKKIFLVLSLLLPCRWQFAEIMLSLMFKPPSILQSDIIMEFSITTSDDIIVLDKGLIIEQGSHNYLLDLKGKYFEMWEKQKA